MKYLPLGNSGVSVSALALGTATFGVAPDEALATRMVALALDLGINIFDTANSYGNQPRFDRAGAPSAAQRKSAEEILGRALKGRRQDIVLCSKVMEPVGPGVNDQGLSRLHIFNQVENSLRRFDTDHIDVYYAHHPDPKTPIEDSLRAFGDLIRQGKIRYCALSTYLPSQMVEALWVAERLGMRAPVCNQVPYNLANREHERDLIPAAARHGVSLTAFSPLAGGLLVGTSGAKNGPVGHQRWGGPGFSEPQLQLAADLQAIAAEGGYAASELALGWLIAQPQVATAIIGPETIGELEAAARAVDLSLPDDVLAAVDGVGKPQFSYY